MARANPLDLKNFYNNAIKRYAPYLQHQFYITFVGKDLPEFMTNGTDKPDESFIYYVQSSSIPEVTVQQKEVAFLSQKFMVPGVVQHNGSWSVNALITNDLKQYYALYQWQQQYADLEYSGGAQPGFTRAIPSIRADVTLLDSTHQKAITTFHLDGVFPVGMPELQFQYENSSTITNVSFNLKYQYMYDDLTEPKDPLAY